MVPIGPRLPRVGFQVPRRLTESRGRETVRGPSLRSMLLPVGSRQSGLPQPAVRRVGTPGRVLLLHRSLQPGSVWVAPRLDDRIGCEPPMVWTHLSTSQRELSRPGLPGGPTQRRAVQHSTRRRSGDAPRLPADSCGRDGRRRQVARPTERRMGERGPVGRGDPADPRSWPLSAPSSAEPPTSSCPAPVTAWRERRTHRPARVRTRRLVRLPEVRE